jgi:hypothetical protein
MRTALAATTAVLVALLVFAGSALADCANGRYDEPLPPITSITPGADVAIEQSYIYPVRFTVVSPIHWVGFYIRVASRPQLGQTGILSDLVDLDDTILTESATDPDYYFGESSFTAVSLTTWMDVPGTYYWQLFGSWRDDAFTCHAFAGPINTITITPSGPPTPASPAGPTAPAPPPPSAPGRPAPSAPGSGPAPTPAGTPGDAARMVHARTGRWPRIRLGCGRTTRHGLRCTLRWSAGRVSYLATGQFTRGPSGLAYDFRGIRAWQTCPRHRRCSTTTARFHWVGHF